MRKEIELQNSSVFNDKNIKTQECINILVNLIYLLNQGETFTEQEKENLFFSVSKLLHSANYSLRRLIFLFVKHLNWWQNSFILTGSLITEINKSEELLKPNCFRLLGQIIDMSSVSVVERLLKVAISNQNADIASSAMICTLFMVFKGFNVAKSWISEISDKLTSSIGQENLLTFHTLLLLKQIKENDKLFLIKIYTKLAENSNIKSQFAKCQLIRFVSEIMRKEELETNTINCFNAFLERCIYSFEESIKIEGCRAILASTKTKASLQSIAMAALCDLITTSKKVVKFAVLRTIDKFIGKYASTLAMEIFVELEKTIEDSNMNSSIKAIALSIFLKISQGLSNDRLEKMFKSFIEQYPTFKEDFKKEVIVISKGISRENTAKNSLYYNFFCSLFKLDSNAATKLEILDALIWFIYNDKNLKIQTIFFLAEFISDCQYEVVKIRILNLLGKECQTALSPGKLIRYIVNQINLEAPMVRASAISALGEIAYKEPNQRATILKYISRSFNDSDNEVRERAYFIHKAIVDLDGSSKTKVSDVIFPESNKAYTLNNLDIDVIQKVLKSEKENLLKSDNISLELSNILQNTEKISQIIKKTEKEPSAKETKGVHKEAKKEEEEGGDSDYKKTMFSKIYGQPKNITDFKPLTNNTAEYPTAYRKIVHDKIVVIDFTVKNSIELQQLNKVSIDIEELKSEGFDFEKTEIIEIEKLSTNETGHLYLKLLKNNDDVISTCSFNIVLKFDLQELDVKGNPHGIAVKETYKIDKVVEISFADYYKKNPKVSLNNLPEIWKMAEKSNYTRQDEKIAMQASNVKEAAKNFTNIIGLNPLNDIENIDKTAKKFELNYAYMSILDSLLFIKFQVIFNDKGKCLAQVIVLSQDERIPEIIINKLYD